MRSCGLKRRFTLIEIVMVLSVVALLAMLLLPVLRKSREKARFARWLGVKDSIIKMPTTVAYYVFDKEYKDADGKVANLATFTDAESYGKNFVQSDMKLTVVNGAIDNYYGRFNGYGGLDVGGSGYSVVPYCDSFDLTDSLSMEVWFKATANMNCVGVLMGKCKSGFNYVYQLKYEGDAGGANGVTAELTWSDNSTFSLSGGGNLAMGNWHHCVFTFDGSEANIYVNGVKKNSSAAVAGKKIKNEGKASSLSIGGPNDGGWSFGNGPAGYISEAALYIRAMTPSEVYANFEQGRNE